MPMTPIEPSYADLVSIERSRLFQAAAIAQKVKGTTAASTEVTNVQKDMVKRYGEFEISTSQMTRLIKRYSLSALTFEALNAIPLSQLSFEEKQFVQYLRRNKNIFERISRLDNDPSSLSVQDIKIAAQLAGDALVLSQHDLEYLRELPLSQQSEQASSSATQKTNATQPTRQPEKPQPQELEALIRKLNEQERSFSYEQLMALNAEQANLNRRERELLNFLKSPTVSKVMEYVAESNQNQVNIDTIRILISLLWNPSIYGTMPIVFYKAPPPHHYDEDVEPVESIDEVEPAENEDEGESPKVQKPHLRLVAHDITAICHKLSPNGHVTLKQIREYQPENFEEAKALNLLRRNSVFHALANLDHQPDTLSDEDITLAMAEGALVLSDPAMILVILP